MHQETYMKQRIKPLLAGSILVFLALFFSSCNKESAGHDHGGHDKVETKGSTKFKTDANLQERMTKIYNTMLALHDKNTDKNKAAKELELTVKDIFATCKLEPEADKILHVALSDVMSAATFVKKKKDKEAMDKLHSALDLYEKRFTPTGW